MSTEIKPRGISLISAYLIISGILCIILIFLSLISRSFLLFISFATRLDFINLSAFLLCYGIMLIAIGAGLYQMRGWALWASILDFSLGIAFSFYTLLVLSPSLIGVALLPTGLNLFMILYLYEKRALFSVLEIRKLLIMALILVLLRVAFIPSSLMFQSKVENLIEVKGVISGGERTKCYVYFYPEVEGDGTTFSSDAVAMSRAENGNFSARIPEGSYRVRVFCLGYSEGDSVAYLKNGSMISIKVDKLPSVKLDALAEDIAGRRINQFNNCIIAEFGFLGLPGEAEALYLKEASKYMRVLIRAEGGEYLRKFEGKNWTVLRWVDIYNKELRCPCIERLTFADENGNATQLICCMRPNFLFKAVNWIKGREVPEISYVEMKFKGDALELNISIQSQRSGRATLLIEKFSYGNITPEAVLRRDVNLERDRNWVNIGLDTRGMEEYGILLFNLRISLISEDEIYDMEVFSIPVKFGRY